MILPSRAQFEEDSKDPPEPSAVRRGLQRTPRAENALGAPNFHRTEHGTPKGRSRSRNYIISRPQNLPYFWETQWLLKPTRLLLVCLSYMAAVKVALCKINPVSWAQTPMPYHPVEAHFHICHHLSTILYKDVCPHLFLFVTICNQSLFCAVLCYAVICFAMLCYSRTCLA